MGNKTKILNIAFIVLNIIIVFIISNNQWVNRMPGPNVDYTLLGDFLDLYIGRDFITILIAIFTIILSFIINKVFIKESLKYKNYIALFIILVIINLIVHRMFIGIAV